MISLHPLPTRPRPTSLGSRPSASRPASPSSPSGPRGRSLPPSCPRRRAHLATPSARTTGEGVPGRSGARPTVTTPSMRATPSYAPTTASARGVLGLGGTQGMFYNLFSFIPTILSYSLLWRFLSSCSVHLTCDHCLFFSFFFFAT